MTTLLEADGVLIQVLIDNVTDSVSSTPPFVTAEWDVLRAGGMSVLSGSCQCCANHGLSLLIRVDVGAKSHTVMFDAGPAGETLEYNVRRLKPDMGCVEAVVLSHGHWDHAGGLIKAFELIRGARAEQAPIPCHMHPGVFVQRGIPRPLGGVLPINPVPSATELAAAGAQPVLSTEPQYLLGGALYLSGEIRRTTVFERGFRGHVRRADDGEAWVPDPLILDERYLAIAIRGRGLLILSACSHAGIVNVVLDASSRFPGMPVFGILGGFHLAGGNEQIIKETVAALGEFELELIAPGHCTGWRAVAALAARFGEKKVVPTAVGQTFAILA